MGLIIAIIIGALAGWLAGIVVRGGGFGLLGNIVLGIVGAVVASYALPAIGLHMGNGFFGSVFSAMIGAIIVLVVIRLVKSA
ncbi:MAG: GlsB/YeaQ/YmgE family stress response membrane protein [Rhodobacteraceae bacterium]|nr:GlsB/YeaQ/YmgE family stress response membrane protein [Paracoccaceae bacterium]